jgi:hypothetical protein
MKRVFWFIGAILAIFFLPWYLTAAIIIAGFLYFSRYYEGILLGLIYDSLYFTGFSGPDIPVWFFGSVVLFLIVYFIRPMIRKDV